MGDGEILNKKTAIEKNILLMKQHCILPQNHIRGLLAILLACVVSGNTLNAQTCGCTNCPQFMPDNFVGNFLINVSGASNPTLGQNGQGVCGVTMHFDHEYLGDLSITLTSPSGQSVQLVGPIGFFGATDGTTWNVTFLPCNDNVDPDPGFSPVWHNNQNWGLGNNYSGSYFPSGGCLENFNSGPVDGTWTLTVVDGQAIDVGNFYNYEIIFCDPAGITCFSCAANAGNLLQPDVTACQGSSSLDLNLPPTYVAPNQPPPASDYSYTYVVGGGGGVIVAYEPGPDLTGYDPGVYTVCGLSYLTVQEGDIPAPNGSLTINQLSTQLNSNQPPFCGKITDNCVNVTINAAPPDIEENIELCSPACHTFFGVNYCQTGVYPRSITTPQGCVYTATLYLTVNQRSFTNLVEFICDGECSTTPGFEFSCSPGVYLETFTNFLGCDSTVTLNLQVLPVNASATPSGNLDCNNPIVQISGVGSTSGAGVSYQWTASNGGNIVGSNSGLNITANAAGDYQLRVCRASAGVFCCDSTSISLINTSIPPNTPAGISGPSSLCQGETASYTATLVPGSTAYSWTLPPGVTINGNPSGNTISVTWNSGSAGQICASSVNDCGTSTPVCINVNVTPTPPPNTPAGNDTLCAGVQWAYNIPAVAGASSYAWSVTGGVLVSGQGGTNVVVDWGNGPNGQLCVNATNVCGTSTDVCLPVQITAPPTSTLALGDSVACPEGTALYTANPVQGATAYNWTLTNGTMLSGQGTDSIELMWDANVGSGIVCVSASNGCGVSTDSCFNVSLSIPAAGQITRVCDGANTNYTVSFPISGGTEPYTIPGGTISGGIFTSDPIPSGQPFSFEISDTNSCVSALIAGAFSCVCATDAGQMTLISLAACEGDSVTAAHLGGEMLDANDVTAFVLHSGTGTILGLPIFGQNTTGTFSHQPGMVYGQTYYISLVAGDNLAGFPDPNDPCLSVAQGQPVVFYQNPTPNAGMDAATCGTVLNLNAAAPGGSSGQWSVLNTPSGGTLSLDNAQNPNTTTTASTFGSYTLLWTLTQNGCVGTDEVMLQFNDSPVLGNLLRDCDAANENYTVTLTISGGAAPYTLNGQPIAGATFVSNPIPNGASYTFDVADANDCTMPQITGAFSCNCSTNAGTMSASPLQVCDGQTIAATSNGDAVLDANDVAVYVLHSGAGQSLGQVFDQNTTGVFSFLAGQMQFGTTYYISLIAGNSIAGIPDPLDPCFSVAPGQPVQWLQIPAPNAGPDLTICGQNIDLQAEGTAFGGTWSVVSGPGTASFANQNSPGSSVNVSATGTYVFRWTELNGICSNADELSVVFNTNPSVTMLSENCNGTNTAYEILFTANNGLAPYTVLGLNGVFTGNFFQSALLPNNSAYAFMLVDANGCESPIYAGVQNCDCATDAGSMQTNPVVFCANEPATVVWNNDANLDANDLVQFILHNAAGAILGSTVFARNSQPSFNFTGNLQFGVTYYISAIAGDNLAGNVDLNDPCLSVAAGTPVQWKPMPTASMLGDATLCLGGTAVLTFSGTGTFPLTVNYTEGGVPNSLTLNGPQAATLNVAPLGTTTYSLLQVSDGTAPNCVSALSGAVTVTVNQPVNAGTVTDALEFCVGTGSVVQLMSLLSGADAGGVWAETSPIPSQGGAFNAATGTFLPNGQPAGIYSFRYRLTASAPCTNDERTVFVTVHPQPFADAGPDKTLDCNVLSANLGGVGSSIGTYSWLLNGVELGTDRQLQTQTGGNYTLVVTNQQGCSATDVVSVVVDAEVPQAGVTTVRHVRCFGETNGAVSVDAVTSTRQPVLYSLNGGPFGAAAQFTGLPAGTYTIRLQDAIGCESETGVLTVVEPPELLIELGPTLKIELADSAHVVLQATVPVNTLQSIVWEPLLDSTAAGKPYQNFFPLHSWQLGVTVQDSNGCTASDRILIQVEKPRKVFIPNVFKPDGGIDPLLFVFGGNDVAAIESFVIFDRWGEQVFEAKNFLPNDPSRGWDGRLKGSSVNPGVFAYFAVVRFIDGEVVMYKGDVTVVR